MSERLIASREERPAAIQALTSARFFAALLVVLHHFAPIINYPPGLWQIAHEGSMGVGFFFILSGFILTYNYYAWFQRDLRRVRDFAWARFARIVPMHVVSLLLITVSNLAFVVLAPNLIPDNQRPDLPGNMGLLSWLANLFLVNVYVPNASFQGMWNDPSWSICAEVFFYLLLPLFVHQVLRRVTTRAALVKLALLLFAVQVALTAAMGAWLAATVPADSLASYFNWLAYRSPFLRVWEFFIGCVLAALVLKTRGAAAPLLSRPARDRLLATALILIPLLCVVPAPAGLLGQLFIYSKLYLLFVPLFALIIISIASGPTFLTALLERPLLILLGEASYSLYLIHWLPVKLLLRLEDVFGPGTTLLGVPAIIATIAASVWFFKNVETPARIAIRRGLARRQVEVEGAPSS